jgi:hypothetical protein
MKSNHFRRYISNVMLQTAMILVVVLFASIAFGQNPAIQQRIAAIKESSAKNKQALAQYTWQEQDTISLKGEVKKQVLYQVRTGPDGKPQKTSLTPTPAPAAESGGRHGRVKAKVVENKKEEYKDYGDQIGALGHKYAQVDPQLLEQALKDGNITMKPGGDDSEPSLVIANYLKPKDSMTIAFSKANKAIQSVQISSYLDSPSDAVNIVVTFDKLPDGTNHVSTINVEGVSKKLTIAIQNSGYQKL